ncbi:CAP GLY domain containing protein, partial [Asbolus verrucosus]
MSTKDFKYGIFIQNELMKELKQGQNQRTALLGQIVKIEAILGGGNVAVRFLKDSETWESTTFCCRQQSIVSVNEKLWPYLYAVTSPQERVKLAKNKERCDKLSNITKDITVGFIDTDQILLGQIMFLGMVRGMGHCVGLKLHQKKKDNKCDGSCAGIQYFNCLPGYGVFTTIDRIVLSNSPLITNKDTTKATDLDLCLEKNVSSLLGNDSKPKNEEIVTRFGEYSKSNLPPKSSTYLRNSLSLQNILETDTVTANSNNDFDQNSIIQPDKSHLIGDKKARIKSEIDLSDIIGGVWHGASDTKELEKFSNLNRTLERNDGDRNGHRENSRANRNKSANILSHFYDSTLPKRNKVATQTAKFYDNTLPRRVNGVKEKNGCASNQEEESNKKINEKSEKASTSSTHNNAQDKPRYHNPRPGTTKDLTIGSLVEVSNDVSEEPLYGVVRWLGAENGTSFVLVGVELEEEHGQLPLTLTDGTHNGERFFKCAENRALFVPLEQCHQDARFQDGIPTPVHHPTEPNFQS